MNNQPPYHDRPSDTPPPPPGTNYTQYAGQSMQGYAQSGPGYVPPAGYAQLGPGYMPSSGYAQPGPGYVPPPGYAQPVYPGVAYVPPVPDPSKGVAITGFVLGIISVCLLCSTVWGAALNLIVATLGIIFSALGRKSRTSRGLAIAGLVMSIIAVVLSLIFFLMLIGIIAASMSAPRYNY